MFNGVLLVAIIATWILKVTSLPKLYYLKKTITCSLSMHLNVVQIFDTKNHLHKIDLKHPFQKARFPISNFAAVGYKGY